MNAYVFDMDGTILSSIDFWKNFGTEILKRYGINKKISPEVLEMATLHEAIVMLKEDFNMEKTVEEIEKDVFIFLYEKYEREFELKSGVIELFSLIKGKGFPIAIATATEKKYVDGMLKCHPELLDYVDFVDCVEIGGPTKKDVEYFEALLSKFKEQPKRVFFFEDSPYSIKTANKVGWTTIALLEDMNPHLRPEAKEISDYCFENLKALDIDILDLD